MCLADFQHGKLLLDLKDVYKRTANMTGKSESTVRGIVEEGSSNNGKFRTPAKHRKGRPRKQLDDFDICATRQKIQFIYTVKKEDPALQKLLMVLKEDIGNDNLNWQLSLNRCQSLMREKYLDMVLRNRDLPEELKKRGPTCWQSIETKGVLEKVSKGERWILVHAGNEKGFVPNVVLIFSGQNKQEDYHFEMNQHNKKKWVLEKLVPNLTEPSIIVMDKCTL